MSLRRASVQPLPILPPLPSVEACLPLVLLSKGQRLHPARLTAVLLQRRAPRNHLLMRHRVDVSAMVLPSVPLQAVQATGRL